MNNPIFNRLRLLWKHIHSPVPKLSHFSFFLILCATLLVPATQAADEDTSSTNSTHSPEIVDTVYPDWFKTSFMELEEDILEAQDSGKRLMLVFHQPGCPYCDALVEQNLSQVDIEETVKSNFDVIEINMWGDLEVVNVDGEEFTEKTFASYLKVQFTPTVLMYHSDGSIAMRINGYFPPDKFRAALQYVMNADTDALTFNDYLAKENPEILGASAQTNKSPVMYAYLKDDDFHSEQTISLAGTDNTKPYVVLFEQRDCSNCVDFHETVLSQENTRKLLDNFNVHRIDMWGKDKVSLPTGEEMTGRELARQLDINYAPTMVVYSADHQEVIRSESWIRQFHTRTMLEYAHTDAWQTQPSFQRFIRERADEIRESGGEVSILE